MSFVMYIILLINYQYSICYLSKRNVFKYIFEILILEANNTND